MKFKFFENKESNVVTISEQNVPVYETSVDNVVNSISSDSFSSYDERRKLKKSVEKGLNKFKSHMTEKVFVVSTSDESSGVIIIDSKAKFVYAFIKVPGQTRRVWRFGRLNSYKTGRDVFNENAYRVELVLENVPSDIKEYIEQKVEVSVDEYAELKAKIRAEIEAELREEIKKEYDEKYNAKLNEFKAQVKASYEEEVSKINSVEVKQLKAELDNSEHRNENNKVRHEEEKRLLIDKIERLEKDVRVLAAYRRENEQNKITNSEIKIEQTDIVHDDLNELLEAL
ncbi:TPA: hypothetical protein JF854_001497 [Enterobacter hormaechei subsp. steigerwaltii]|uniref:hypothetical protein n=1 Tax=Enterobacter cloacae TaxID=550 RepID=UPI0007965F5B|nr:hypothetical protein [Enterobacter cloacae]SAH98794.1 Uncharacterised protein [Enterobacter cloacae]HAS0890274.1 hypothetical protein [Enterobacter hormaechei subsp. steigerwaltii]HAT7679700.1 hypothetical protein [Enterobacter hormaechei subsp. steigerwaltii]HAV1001485.1 hypothetical protein [Enterobacter hormaechei subsp. steigerwaltii]